MSLLHVTNDNFEEVVMNAKEPVLLDFWAPWCGPCKALGPVVEELAGEAEGFQVGKVNVDEEDELALKFKVASIPTVLVVKDGQVVEKSIGLVSKDRLVELVAAHK